MAKMYAHAVIHDHENEIYYERGDEVTTDIPGYDELVEAGSIQGVPWEPESPEEEKLDAMVHGDDGTKHIISSDEWSGNDDSA